MLIILLTISPVETLYAAITAIYGPKQGDHARHVTNPNINELDTFPSVCFKYPILKIVGS